VLKPSLPLAIWVGVVERLVAAPQAPPKPPVTDPQETVTALAGTVAQEAKAAGALTFRVQAPKTLPLVVQLTLAAEDPFTTGVPVGSVAENVIAAGVAEAPERVTASGCSLTAAGVATPGAREADARRTPESSSVDNIRSAFVY
jgi:hypothetical protein